MKLNGAFADHAREDGYAGFDAFKDGPMTFSSEFPWRFTPTVFYKTSARKPGYYADGSVLSCPSAHPDTHIAQDYLPIRFGMPNYDMTDPQGLQYLHRRVIGSSSDSILVMDAGVDPVVGRNSYGTPDPAPASPNGAIWYAKPGWLMGLNVTRRHGGGCNGLFLDGHSEYFPDSDSPGSELFIDIDQSPHRWADTWYK
jgi:prepilin-type processing-associated H-X9-DG protein